MIVIKLCPFCGSKPYESPPINARQFHIVCCPDDKCPLANIPFSLRKWNNRVDQSKLLMGVNECAKFCKVTVQAIRKAIKEKRLNALKIGNAWVVNSLDLTYAVAKERIKKRDRES